MFIGEDVVCETTMLPETTAYPEVAVAAADSGTPSVLIAGILGPIVMIVVIALALCLYVLPTIVALVRRHTQKVPIILVNLLLGWTFIGWVVALVWSFINEKKPTYNPYGNINAGNSYNNVNGGNQYGGIYDNYSNNNFNNM